MSGRVRGASLRLAGPLAFLAAVVVTAAAAQTPAGSPVPFATVASGKFSRIHTPLTLVIRTQAEWADLWHRAAGPGGPVPPAVDFRRDMVIGVFAGQVSEPAAVSITRVVRASDRLVISYTLTSTRPPLDAGGPASFAPFHIVRLARSPLPGEFVRVKTPPVLRRLPQEMS